MEKYIKGLYWKIKYNEKMKATIKIQAYFRMITLRRRFLDLRDQAIKIQRNWRKYYHDK
jgi:CRISPR/Cas system-associated exonuclease Cas4 (RecB family)